MIEIVGGSDLTCRLTGEKTHKREVGYCTTAEGVDINRAIIEQGVALACPRFDRRYLPYEQADALAGQFLPRPALGLVPHRAGVRSGLLQRLIAGEDVRPQAALGRSSQ